MVSFADVLNNNESLKQAGSGLVAVVLGGTDGIGKAFLKALAKHTDSPTAYVVGRSHSKLEALFTELRQINGSATLIPIIANDLTLVKDAQTAAEEIVQKVKKIDLLVMSPGFLNVSRNESSEGLDRGTAISFYSRMRFMLTLMHALRAAPSPRVVSVLAGGQEGQIWADDLLLKEHYSLTVAAGARAAMTTLFLEEFAEQPENEKIVFVHLYPGFVGGTGIEILGVGWVTQLLLNWVAAPLMRMFGYTAEEAGERVLFAATNGRFRKLENGRSAEGSMLQVGSNGKIGSGLYLVQGNSEVTPNSKVVKQLKEQGMNKIVYDHTLEVFDNVSRT